MPTWDELFKAGASFEGVEAEVARLATLIQSTFTLNPSDVKLWDIGCGTGRHTAYLARLGFDVHASDNSPTALAKTRDVIEQEGHVVTITEADMEEAPFGETLFHGIIIWNVMQHATIEKIGNVLGMIKDHLLPRGYLVLSVKSIHAEEAGQGEAIEEGTYVMADGPEIGVPHHYFSKDELESLIAPLAIIHFIENQEDIFAVATSRPIATKKMPYHNAHWVIIAQKPEMT
jgi:2-polyprenyl-3-methyl-5-hydroxy-6-metoxy-1,4-benzoquinol methylase